MKPILRIISKEAPIPVMLQLARNNGFKSNRYVLKMSIHSFIHSFIHSSIHHHHLHHHHHVGRLVTSPQPLQSQFSTEHNVVLPLSISSNFSLPKCYHPVASYVFFLVFSSHIFLTVFPYIYYVTVRNKETCTG